MSSSPKERRINVPGKVRLIKSLSHSGLAASKPGVQCKNTTHTIKDVPGLGGKAVFLITLVGQSRSFPAISSPRHSRASPVFTPDCAPGRRKSPNLADRLPLLPNRNNLFNFVNRSRLPVSEGEVTPLDRLKELRSPVPVATPKTRRASQYRIPAAGSQGAWILQTTCHRTHVKKNPLR